MRKKIGGIFRGVSVDSLALSLCIWIIVELLLCAWNQRLGDFVAKFVDVELLIAQFVATLIVWLISLAMAFSEAEKDPQLSLTSESRDTVLMLKEEASKVPIFFAAAIVVSAICKVIALCADWSGNGLAGLYVVLAWLAGAIALILFAGVVNYKTG